MACLIPQPITAVPATALADEPAPQFVSRFWNQNNGAPTNRINDLILGSDGFLWLATYEGLVRFDGAQHRLFNESDHPALLGGIFTLCETRPGTIWMVSTSGSLIRLQNQRFDSWVLGDYLPAPDIVEIKTGPNNRPILLSAIGLVTIDANDQIVLWQDYPLPDEPILEFAFSPNQTLWLLLAGNRLAEVTADGSRIHDLAAMGGMGSRTANLHVASDRMIWLAIDGQLAKFDSETRQLYLIPREQFHMPNRRLRFSRNSGENFLLGSISSPVYFVRNDKVLQLSLSHDENEMLTRVIALPDGSFAAATYRRGLLLLSPSQVRTFGNKHGLTGTLVNAISNFDDNIRILATDRGAFLFDGVQFHPLPGNLDFDQYGVDVFVDSQQRIWLGTIGEGAMMFADGEWHRIDASDGLPTSSIRSFAEDSHGNIWIGTTNGVAKWNGSVQKVYGLEQGMRSAYVIAMAVDDEDTLWVGTRSGLHRTVDGEIAALEDSPHTPPPGFAIRTIFAMQPDQQGNLWGGMTGGVFQIRNGAIQFINLSEDLGATAIFHVFEDHLGSFWLTSSRGLFQVSAAQLRARLVNPEAPLSNVRLFDSRDGLPGDAIRPASRMARSDDAFWIPAEQGFFILRPNQIRPIAPAPAVHIEELIVNGIPRPELLAASAAAVKIEPGLRRIQFIFASPQFHSPETLRFEIRLLGFESDWRSTQMRRAEFTYLRPGKYIFEVHALDRNGDRTSTPARMEFIVTPFFHETVWLYLVILIVLSAAVAGTFYVRTRILKDRQRQLEIIVAKRTEEIRQREAELAKSNQRLEALIKENKEFMGIAAHDLKNPLGAIETLVEMLDEELKQRQLQDLREWTEGVLQSVRNMSALIVNLLDINRIEQGMANLEIQPVAGADIFKKLPTAYRKALIDKDLRVVQSIYPLDDIQVLADPSFLHQILDNLFSNAIKYSPHGSSIEIRLERKANKIRFAVADQGPGIPKAEQPKLFGKFVRLSPQPTGGESSTGLGLSIAKRLTEIMNGQIGCDSIEGHGSTFWIELPVYYIGMD